MFFFTDLKSDNVTFPSSENPTHLLTNPSGNLIPLISDSSRTASAKVSATKTYKSVLIGHPCLIPLERLK